MIPCRPRMEAPVGKSGPLMKRIRASAPLASSASSGWSSRWTVASTTLGQVVGRDVGGHAHRDALAAVDQQVGEPGREHGRLGELTGVGVDEVDRLLVDPVQQSVGDRRQAALGVAGRGRAVVGRAVVALEVDERVAEAERLRHPHHGVIDGPVAVGVVLAHDVAADPGALQAGPVRAGPHLVHPEQDPPVDRLEPVARVGQGPADDDRHGVVEEGALHLLLDLDGLDTGEGHGGRAVVGAIPGRVGRQRVTHMSRNLTSLALVWMKCLRTSTSSPIRVERTSSARAACSTET